MNLYQKIQEETSKGDISKALELLSQCAEQSGDRNFKNSVLLLSSRYNQNTRDNLNGILSSDNFRIEQNRIVHALLAYADRCGSLDARSIPNSSFSTPKVFISYSSEDDEFIEKLKPAFENHDIEVLIDKTKLGVGKNISKFIDRVTKESDVTLLVVSINSLLSDWVAAESMLALMHERVNQEQRFIACYIDNALFDEHITLKLAKAIDEKIKDYESLIAEYHQNNLDTIDINSKMTRLRKSRSNLPELMNRLREYYTLDMQENVFDENLPKLITSIKEAKREKA